MFFSVLLKALTSANVICTNTNIVLQLFSVIDEINSPPLMSGLCSFQCITNTLRSAHKQIPANCEAGRPVAEQQCLYPYLALSTASVQIANDVVVLCGAENTQPAQYLLSKSE